MILGCINALVVVVFGSIMAYLLYGVNVLVFGWLLVLLFALLVQSGWIIGSFSAGCIMYGGLRIQKIIWVLGWFFAPFSALFYALDSLPTWAYIFAKAIPMSYVLEGLRSYAHSGLYPWSYLLTALVLNCIYLVGALYFLVSMFFASKTKGLARLESE
jgi:ABC-2 type transport system permease protein